MSHEALTRIAQCRHGTLRYFVNDAFIGRSLDLYGEFSEGEAGLFRQLVRPGAWVIEAGANIGALTLPIAQAAGAGGRVLAYEPQSALWELLRENLASNGLIQAEARRAALGDSPGLIRIPPVDYARGGNFGGVSLGGEAGEAVAVETIDGLAPARLDLLKIDVEGMEHAVLTGGTATIRRTRPILYVENDRVERSAALIALILSLGYRLWWHFTPLFNAGNVRANPTNVFGNILSINLLGIPAERPANIRGMIPVRGPEETWLDVRDRHASPPAAP